MHAREHVELVMHTVIVCARGARASEPSPLLREHEYATPRRRRCRISPLGKFCHKGAVALCDGVRAASTMVGQPYRNRHRTMYAQECKTPICGRHLRRYLDFNLCPGCTWMARRGAVCELPPDRVREEAAAYAIAMGRL